MRVLVLGGCGFVGSHAVDAALATGHEVRVLSRRADQMRAPLASVDYHLGDASDPAVLQDALRGCDAVLHTLSTSHPASAEHDPEGDVSGNLVGLLRVLSAMRATGVHRLVYLSSGGAVYGPPDTLPVSETHPLRPIGSYGIVKVAAEAYIAHAARQGLVASVIRPANAFGHRQSGAKNPGFISTALMRLRDGAPLDILGDGSVVRDYLPVTDLADLCLRTLQDGAGLTVNAGTGTGRSLLEVVEAIARVTGRRPILNFLPGRSVDVPLSVLDTSLAEQRLGWTSQTRFEDAIAMTWGWLQSH